jgi:AAA15 family ATPase/GTPase
LPYFEYNQNKNLNQFVRLENKPEIFFNGNVDEKILINTDKNDSCEVSYFDGEGKKRDSYNLFQIKEYDYKDIEIRADNQLILSSLYTGNETRIKYYKYEYKLFFENIDDLNFLIPLHGNNLFYVLQYKKELKKELIKFFSEYGLKLLFDKANYSLRVMKETEEGEVFSVPYNSIADTLQRLIFYKTAIASNENSILLFEEPEAHCFPPYIAYFTQEAIDSETNQFFIATHSPYVLHDFLKYQRDDVAIFMADFKNGQTVIKRLTEQQVRDVYEYGIDLFFNSELFTDEI